MPSRAMASAPRGRRPAQDRNRPTDDVRLLDLSEREFMRHIKQKGLGGGDVAAIVGLSRWKTRQEVWEQKMGICLPERDNVDKRRGKALEAIACDEYKVATGRKLRPGRTIIRPGAKYWMRGTPDRFIVAPRPTFATPHTQGDGILEVKCLRLDGYYRTRDEGIDPGYYVQLQWYERLADKKWGAFAIFNAEDWALHEFDVVCDPAFGEWLEEEARKFWFEHVLARTSPNIGEDVVVPATHLATMRAANGAQTFDVEALSGAANRAPWRIAIEALTRARAELTLAERADELATARVKELMDEHGYEAIRGFGASISYREQTRHSLSRELVSQHMSDELLEACTVATASRPFRFTLRTPGDTRRSRGTTSNPERPAGLEAEFAPSIVDSIASGRPIDIGTVSPGDRVQVRMGTPETPGPIIGEVPVPYTAIDWASPLDGQWTMATREHEPFQMTERDLQRAVETIERHSHTAELEIVTPAEAERRYAENERPDVPEALESTIELPADGDDATSAVDAPRRPRDGAQTDDFEPAQIRRARPRCRHCGEVRGRHLGPRALCRVRTIDEIPEPSTPLTHFEPRCCHAIRDVSRK